MIQQRNDPYQDKAEHHYRWSSLLIIVVVQIVILFMYGFFASYNATVLYTTNLQYIFTNLLAAVGFGLLLVYFRFGIMQTIIISLIVCSINAQLGPLMEQFWFNVFIKGFPQTTQILDATSSYKLMTDTATNNIYNFTLGFVRISTFCSISLLVALTSVIGKIGITNTIITTIIFDIGFNLNYYLNYLIFLRGHPTGQLFIMDDFQGSRVFTFGAGFGIALLLLYHRLNPIQRNQNAQYTDIFASIFTLLGTCFILAFFYYVLDTYRLGDSYLGLMNLYFAFSGCIVTGIAVSSILDGVIRFHHVNMTVIAGVVQVSIIGTFIKTPYVSLLVGALAGLVTAILSHLFWERQYKKYIRDSKSIILIYFVNCMLGSYFVCPIIIKAYANLTGQNIYNAGFHMIYTSISLGIGFVFGLLASLFRCCFAQNIPLSDIEFFNKHFMLPLAPRQRPIKQQPATVTYQQPESQQMFSLHKSRAETTKHQETGIFIKV